MKGRRPPKSDKVEEPGRGKRDKKTMKDSSGKKSQARTEDKKVDDGESASSLFKEAIAAFEEAQGAPRERARGRSRAREEPRPAEVDVVADGEAEGAEGAKEAKGAKGAEKAKGTVEPSPPREPEPAPGEAEAVKEASGESPSRKDAPEAEPGRAPDSPKEKPGPATRESLPAADALAMIERRKLRKTLRREGEPESPAGAYEPKEVEYHGALMKFTCRCGKRVSVAIDAAQTVGRCPKCGSRLVVPVAGRSKPDGQASDEPKKSRKKPRASRSRHRAVRDVANRMRRSRTAAKKVAQPVEVVAAGTEAEPAPADRHAWGTRVSAFAIDQTILATVFFVAVSLLEVVGLGSSRWALAAALACVTWAANRVVILWLFAASVGMLMVGLRLRLADGGTVPFARTALRAATGVALLLLAPFALRDREGRAPADRASGTLIVPGERVF